MKTLNGISLFHYLLHNGAICRVWKIEEYKAAEWHSEIICDVEIGENSFSAVNAEDLEPIPITPKSLGWLGFKGHEISFPLGMEFSLVIRDICINIFLGNDSDLCELHVVDLDSNGHTHINYVQYIHQLQAALVIVDPEAVLEYKPNDLH